MRTQGSLTVVESVTRCTASGLVDCRAGPGWVCDRPGRRQATPRRLRSQFVCSFGQWPEHRPQPLQPTVGTTPAVRLPRSHAPYENEGRLGPDSSNRCSCRHYDSSGETRSAAMASTLQRLSCRRLSEGDNACSCQLLAAAETLRQLEKQHYVVVTLPTAYHQTSTTDIKPNRQVASIEVRLDFSSAWQSGRIRTRLFAQERSPR